MKRYQNWQHEATPAPALRSSSRRMSLGVAATARPVTRVIHEVPNDGNQSCDLVTHRYIQGEALKLIVSKKLAARRSEVDRNLVSLETQKFENAQSRLNLQFKNSIISTLGSSTNVCIMMLEELRSLEGKISQQCNGIGNLKEHVNAHVNSLTLKGCKPISIGSNFDKICEQVESLSNATLDLHVTEDSTKYCSARNALESISAVGSKLGSDCESLESLQNGAYFVLHQEAALPEIN